jgi:NAD+ synthase (glutamine-hydrolysing)
MKYGYIKTAAAVPEVKPADTDFNTDRIVELIKKAENQGTSIIVFPELCITGYTCADLFYQDKLLNEALNSLKRIAKETTDLNITVITGLPLSVNNKLYNCAAVTENGKILGIIPKTIIPNTNEFYEHRWFSEASTAENIKNIFINGETIPFGTDLLFETEGIPFGIEICEDLWGPSTPSASASTAGALLIFNLSASNELLMKDNYRRQIISTKSASTLSGYIYTSAGKGESTTDTVYSGCAYITENGRFLKSSSPFSDTELITADIDTEKLKHDRLKSQFYKNFKQEKIYRTIKTGTNNKNYNIEPEMIPMPFVPSDKNEREIRCKEIFDIQAYGLLKRLNHIGTQKCVIGISGGLDSTLALLAVYYAFKKQNIDPSNIIAVTMPGFGTTSRTLNNSEQLMKALNVTLLNIPISKASIQHFEDIGHNPEIHDVTYENTQARERTQILMDLANKYKGIVIGTGDMSELALGWATYNGDHMSMYGINSGIPKTLIKYLVSWYSSHTENTIIKETLTDVLDTPVSPELLPASQDGTISQKTEDLVGPYLLHDYFLYYFLRYGFSPAKIFFLATNTFKEQYSNEKILYWMKNFYRRFFSQQFKRSCLPDGPKIGSVNLSPRGDWRMPSDSSPAIWLKELEKLK